MDLKSYLTAMTVPDRETFSQRCGTTRGHLQNVMYGLRPCAPELAVAIERESGRQVTRQELFPSNFRDYWPELTAVRTARSHPGERDTEKPNWKAGS